MRLKQDRELLVSESRLQNLPISASKIFKDHIIIVTQRRSGSKRNGQWMILKKVPLAGGCLALISDVRAVVLELNGEITVVKKSVGSGETSLNDVKHLRFRFWPQ